MIYIICFIFSTFFTYIAQKNFDKNKKKEGIFWSILAILIPSILAGLRDNSIGSDIEAYVTRLFEIAKNTTSLSTFLNMSWVENGYTILIFGITYLTKDIHWILFFTELIMCVFLYLTAYDKRKYIPMWFVMLIYFGTFYNISLCLMRQGIAIFITMYALTRMEKKQYLLTFLLFILAIQFHSSAIVTLPMYILIYIDKRKISLKTKTSLYVIIIFFLIIMIFSYNSVLKYLTYDLNILPTKYYDYLNSEKSEKFDINFTELLFKILWVVLYIVQMFVNNKNDEKYEFKSNIYFIFILIDFLTYPISFKILNASRMTLYYGIIGIILLIPYLTNIFKKDLFNQTCGRSIIIGIVYLYWFCTFILFKIYETYPYISDVVHF